MPRLLSALRDHLIAAAIVRDPRVAGGLPPMFIARQLGAPAPGEGQGTEIGPDTTVNASISGGFAPEPFAGSWQRRPIGELRIRTREAHRAEDLEQAVSAAVIDRRGWDMAGLLVLESQQWRALTPLGSDEQGFEFLVAYWFELYR